MGETHVGASRGRDASGREVVGTQMLGPGLAWNKHSVDQMLNAALRRSWHLRRPQVECPRDPPLGALPMLLEGPMNAP